MKYSHYLMMILAAGAVLQLFYYYPLLPHSLATHFDGLGEPNGWSTRTGFFAVYLGVIALNLLIFLPMPRLLARGSSRRAAILHDPRTLARLQTVLGGFGVINLALALYVGQLVLAANLAPPPRLPDTILLVLGIYLGLVIGGVVWILYTNRRAARS